MKPFILFLGFKDVYINANYRSLFRDDRRCSLSSSVNGINNVVRFGRTVWRRRRRLSYIPNRFACFTCILPQPVAKLASLCSRDRYLCLLHACNCNRIANLKPNSIPLPRSRTLTSSLHERLNIQPAQHLQPVGCWSGSAACPSDSRIPGTATYNSAFVARSTRYPKHLNKPFLLSRTRSIFFLQCLRLCIQLRHR